MKKYLFTLLLILVCFLYGQAYTPMATAAYVRGYWTEWEYHIFSEFKISMQYERYDNSFSGMEFREKGNQPWDWCFKFELDNYVKPDKKTRKQHQKNKTWYEYSGWVEYYVSDDYPTIQKVLEHYRFPMVEPNGDSARAKRRARATIKIAPYKKTPECFNIYFDGVGVAISFDRCPFANSYFVQ